MHCTCLIMNFSIYTCKLAFVERSYCSPSTIPKVFYHVTKEGVKLFFKYATGNEKGNH